MINHQKIKIINNQNRKIIVNIIIIISIIITITTIIKINITTIRTIITIIITITITIIITITTITIMVTTITIMVIIIITNIVDTTIINIVIIILKNQFLCQIMIKNKIVINHMLIDIDSIKINFLKYNKKLSIINLKQRQQANQKNSNIKISIEIIKLILQDILIQT